VIRRARGDEIAWVADTIAAAFGRYVPRLGRVPMPMTADHAAMVAAGEVHVLEEAGERLGLIVLRPAADHLYVDILAVLPSAQGRGSGQRLLAFAESEARRLGLPALRLLTNVLMTENLRFYPRRGFRETERRVEDGIGQVNFEKRLG
jgi:ribosomal protein S18 acetylase RimI-like enzyme